MFRERISIWFPAAFSFLLAAMVVFWQFRYPSDYRLSPGAFGLLMHMPIIVGVLCMWLDRHEKAIDRLGAERG